nr:MAG TPA: hypothetical protein [Caudoviricetes sp.]
MGKYVFHFLFPLCRWLSTTVAIIRYIDLNAISPIKNIFISLLNKGK